MKKSTLMLSVIGVLCAVLVVLGMMIRHGEKEEKTSTSPTGNVEIVDTTATENLESTSNAQVEGTIMYATENMYVYKNADLSEEIGMLVAGEQVNTIEVVDKLFTKVIYNDTYAYVITSFLSENQEDVVEETAPVDETEAEPEYFIDECGYTHIVTNEDVTVEMDVNLRKGPTKGYPTITILKMGQTVVRIGVGENGWSKIRLSDGTEGYLASYYLRPVKDPVYTQVSETVYLTQDANVRSGPSIRRDQLGDVKKGVAILRIGVGSDGWSKVVYEGAEAYIYSMYLTTISPYGEMVDNATYREVNETVYASVKVNLRMGPGSGYVTVTTLQKGDSVQRIGIGSNGWSKVMYDGQELYAYTKYLTTKEP